MSPRTRFYFLITSKLPWFIQRISLGLLAGLSLMILISFIIMVSSRQDDPPTNLIDNSMSAIFTLDYNSTIKYNDSLVVSDLSGLAQQIAKAYSISINIIRVHSARFVQSLIISKRKRQITSDDDVGVNTSSDLFVIECEVTYPVRCGGIKICNDRFTSVVLRTINLAPPELSYSISFTTGLTLNVVLTFVSINGTMVTAPINTTTITLSTGTTLSTSMTNLPFTTTTTTTIATPSVTAALTTIVTPNSPTTTTSISIATTDSTTTTVSTSIATTDSTTATASTSIATNDSTTTTTIYSVVVLPPPACTINCPLNFSSYDTTTTCGRVCYDVNHDYYCDNTTSTTYCGRPGYNGVDAIYIGTGYRSYGCGAATDSCGGNGELYISTGGYTGCCAYTGSTFLCMLC